MELTKQNDYQCMEEAGRIWLDMMAAKYGTRMVETSLDMDKPGEQPLGMQLPKQTFMRPFDFGVLRELQMSIKQDVGACSYWSEMASMQTLDNLLMNHLITPKQYLERLPNGYITKKQELLDDFEAAAMAGAPSGNPGTGMSVQTTSEDMPVNGGGGNGALQRALNREGA